MDFVGGGTRAWMEFQDQGHGGGTTRSQTGSFSLGGFFSLLFLAI